ncbi:DUF349 domain-containing protein [Schleiferia thermophila]|jgi:hypothetical protein|nr:DUF349 domain-containing protein [Schleiferia thermophila]KFD38869.1 hypothetical protein AT05_08330 [Schleiferia thermophila str. Yellowstone]GCD79773.1 hypothetical protein JCM30197_10200 [Schleiferia thermophila]
MSNNFSEQEEMKTTFVENEVNKTAITDNESTAKSEELDDNVLEHQDDEDHHEADEQHSDNIFKHYEEDSPEELYKKAVKLIKNELVTEIKEHIEAIKRHILFHLDEERREKLQAFVEDGGNEIDFSYEQPLRQKFKEIYSEFRQKLNEYYKKRKEELESNLYQKKLILEELKTLSMNADITEETFERVRTLQDNWKKIGPIPYSESEHIYRLYHFYLDKFYDNLKLNKEFRDLHFKKNQEKKEEIIQKAKELLESDFEKISDLTKAIKLLEKEWREVGPVPKENREELWKTFNEILDQVREKKSELSELIKKEREEKIQQKKEILRELETIDLNEIKTHDQWQELINKIPSYTERFKKIGRVLHPENDTIWQQFNSTIRNIIRAKNAFYKAIKQVQGTNLEKKRELVRLAAENVERTDWDEAVNFFKKIQSEWKKIGPVPKKYSESVWTEFRETCNKFFDRYHEYLKEKDKELFDNLEKKKLFFEELKNIAESSISPDYLTQQIEHWKSLGKVPPGNQEIEREFHKLIDSYFEKLDLNKNEIYLIRFELKMNNLWEQGDKLAVYNERQRLVRMYDEVRKELNLLENNINLFTSKSGGNPFVKEVEKNIQRHKENLELIVKKLEVLNKFSFEDLKVDKTRDSKPRKKDKKDRKKR